ncbi:MAG: hypothetical protein EPO24_14015 [Bacteroidetes bacterium]|nr:MAG: hypothetical protein EPO24_14015 [Bacteroidota bacterium]
MYIVGVKTTTKLLYRFRFQQVRQRGGHEFFRHLDGRTTTRPYQGGRGISRPLLIVFHILFTATTVLHCELKFGHHKDILQNVNKAEIIDSSKINFENYSQSRWFNKAKNVFFVKGVNWEIKPAEIASQAIVVFKLDDGCSLYFTANARLPIIFVKEEFSFLMPPGAYIEKVEIIAVMGSELDPKPYQRDVTELDCVDSSKIRFNEYTQSKWYDKSKHNLTINGCKWDIEPKEKQFKTIIVLRDEKERYYFVKNGYINLSSFFNHMEISFLLPQGAYVKSFNWYSYGRLVSDSKNDAIKRSDKEISSIKNFVVKFIGVSIVLFLIAFLLKKFYVRKEKKKRVQDRFSETNTQSSNSNGEQRFEDGEEEHADQFDTSRITTINKALATFGLGPSPTPQQIYDSYRKMMKQYHPDKVAHLGPKLRSVAEEESKRINESYEILVKKFGSHYP